MKISEMAQKLFMTKVYIYKTCVTKECRVRYTYCIKLWLIVNFVDSVTTYSVMMVFALPCYLLTTIHGTHKKVVRRTTRSYSR